MAGYKATPRTVTIQFAEDHEHYGAEARARRMTYGEWEALTGEDGGEASNETNALKEFTLRLVSWNLTDDNDQPIPATAEGMRQVDTSLVAALKDAWLSSLIGVHAADPLPESSLSGGPSLVESVPMEALSPSLAS